MTWQDWLIGLVQVVFILALIPSLLGPSKPDFWTSILTGACLWTLAWVYATLMLVFSAAIALMLGCLWFALAAQVLRRERRKRYIEQRYHFDRWQPWSGSIMKRRWWEGY